MSNAVTFWPSELSNANPAAKFLWLLLLLVVRDKFSRVTLLQKGKSEILVKMDACELVPAPRHLFPAFVKLATNCSQQRQYGLVLQGRKADAQAEIRR
jgi:hypothetical protein